MNLSRYLFTLSLTVVVKFGFSQSAVLQQALSFTSTINGKPTKFYSVTINVTTDKYDSLYISGFGKIKTPSSAVFITADSIVLVKTKDKKTILQRLPIDNPILLQGIDKPEVPAPGDFPANFRTEPIANPGNFEIALAKVVNDLSPFGPFPFESNNKRNIITPFIDLPKSENPETNGQLSAMISYTYLENNKPSVRLYFITRENRTHSPKWRPAGPEVNKVAKEFIDNLIKSIL